MIDEQTFEDAVWNDLDLHQLDIIGLGEHEASLRFKGLAGGNIDISFTDYEPWEDDWIPHLISLTDEPFGGVTISGTGSVKLSKDWTHIEEVTQLILEQEEIVLHYDCRNQTVDTYT
jgi:hypothetical protein